MKFATCLFDTQVYIAYSHVIAKLEPGWLSAVVLQELTVGSNGRTELEAHRATLRNYQPGPIAGAHGGSLVPGRAHPQQLPQRFEPRRSAAPPSQPGASPETEPHP